MVTGCDYLVSRPSKQMTSSTDVHKGQEEIGSFVVAIVFSFFFLSASLLRLPVYICVKRDVSD